MKRLVIFLVFLLLCGARLEAEVTCQLNNTSGVSFMTYSGATLTARGSIDVTCPNNVAYTIELSAGTTAGATTTNRMLYCSGCTPQTLGYQLFSDASYTVNWGNDTLTGKSETGSGQDQSIPVYALIPANEPFYTGSSGSNYNDTVTVTIVCNSCTSISGNNRGLTVHLQQTASGCWFSASDLSFGNYNGTVTNATSTIQVDCSSGTPYNVGLNQGTHGGSVTTRKMQNGTHLLSYSLCQNSTCATNWGNTIGTDTVAGTGSGVAQPLTVYGQLPASQSVTTGTYTDTIVATITY